MAHTYVSNASKSWIRVFMKPVDSNIPNSSKQNISAEAKIGPIKLNANQSSTSYSNDDKQYTRIAAGKSLSFDMGKAKRCQICILDSDGKEITEGYSIQNGRNAIVDKSNYLRLGKKKTFLDKFGGRKKSLKWTDEDGNIHQPTTDLSKADSVCSLSGSIASSASVDSNNITDKFIRTDSSSGQQSEKHIFT